MNKIADKVADLVDEFWFVHYSDEPLHGRMLQFLEWLSVSEPEGEPIKDGGSEEYQRLLYWVLMEKQGQKVPWSGKFHYDHENGLAWFVRWTKEEWKEHLKSNPLPEPPKVEKVDDFDITRFM